MKNKNLIWLAAAAVAAIYLLKCKKKPQGQVIVDSIETITQEQFEAGTGQQVKKETAKKILTAAAKTAQKLLTKKPKTVTPVSAWDFRNVVQAAKAVKNKEKKNIGDFY